MKKTYVLFNPRSANGRGEKKAHELESLLSEENLVFLNILKFSYDEFLMNLSPEDEVIVCGGDGTLNHFINEIKKYDIKNDFFLYPAGSGNDFMTDIEKKAKNGPVKINDYLKNLPSVKVNGKEYSFINGIGLGVDGYACIESSRLREKKGKPVSYVSVAIKGILKAFTPFNAKITVDGKEYSYKNLWLASTMKGRFCGGGLMFTPNQKRTADKLSLMAVHDVSKLRLLTILPLAFKGKHINYTKYVDIIEGTHIIVETDRPCPMQIDGETLPNVTKYETYIHKTENAKK